MKKLLLLLIITTVSYSQEATIHFYGSSTKTTGAEILVHLGNTESTYLGGGFSGAWNVKESVKTHINDYDLKQQITKSYNEQWCSLYAVGSAGYLGSTMIKYKAGLSVYNHKIDFKTLNGYEYTKIDKVKFDYLVGISAMHYILNDVAIEVGFDTFNKAILGFTILF